MYYQCGLIDAKRLRTYLKCTAFSLFFVYVIFYTLNYSHSSTSHGNSIEKRDRNDSATSFTKRHLLTANFTIQDAGEFQECASIHQLPEHQKKNQTVLCNFVKTVPACKSDGGIIPYFQFVYCVMPIKLLPLTMTILFVWLLFLFLFLGTTAEEYFCPALTVISQVLRLSQNVAGVTLLAFGNGAPDIFSALAAINQPNAKRASLAFGALFGAGMFVTTIVVGAVVVTKPFTLTRRPYMRDLIFYLAAVYWTFFVLWENRMSIGISLGFISLYLGYVLVVIFGRLIYQKWKKKRLSNTGDIPKPLPKPVGQELYISTTQQQTQNGEPYLNGVVPTISRDDHDRSPSPPPSRDTPNIVIVDASGEYERSGHHKHVHMEDGELRPHSPHTTRERCASRASQHVYGISDEEEDEEKVIKETKHDNKTYHRLPSPTGPHRRTPSPSASPHRLRKTLSGALDITEDVGLVAVGANPNLSKIWHHAYRKEIAHTPRGSPLLEARSRASSRSRTSSQLEASNSSHHRPNIEDIETDLEEDNETAPLITPQFDAPKVYHPFIKLLLAFWPFGEDFKRLSILGKIYETAKIPISILLTLTVPVIDKDEDNDKWNKWLNVLQCITAPLFISLTTKVGFKMIGGVVPAITIAFILGVALASIVAFTSSNNKPPRYHCVFAWLGFMVAIIWIYTIANEIVNLLQVFGIVVDLSDGILGITLLAWGNSIGDAVANVTMAKQGFPRMAIGACFGGPLLNMLLGIGIASTVKAIGSGWAFELYFTQVQMFAALFLLLSLSSSLIITSCLRFKMRRLYGICLFVFYLIFLIVVILAEVKVFDIDIEGVLEPV